MATPLEITFHGPFVFHFTADTAWAYLANCPNHYLNITTDTDDVVFDSGQTIRLSGPTAGTTVNKSVNPIISLKWDSKWSTSVWKYVFQFPAPDAIFGLGSEYIGIHGGPKPWNGPAARGLRFQYDDSTNPQFAAIPPQPINAIHYDGDNSTYAIEVRYHDVSVDDDPNDDGYEDARECFQNMRNLLPPCDQWKVIFGSPTTSSIVPRIGIRTGPNPKDCAAPVMVLTDDGITL